MSQEKEITVAPPSSVDMAVKAERNTKHGLYKGFTPEKGAAIQNIVAQSSDDLFEAIDRPRCQKNDLAEIKLRTQEYLMKCATRQWLPSIDGLSIALGITRTTFYRWLDDTNNGEVCEFLNRVRYSFADMNANAAQSGLTNVIAFIFGAKNFYGYTDKTELSIAPVNPLGNQTDPEELKRKYIEATSTDYPTIDADKYTQKSDNE